jgi:hypothetical protein
MLAREKSQREEGSQTGGRERKKRQKWPEKAQNKAREVGQIESGSQGVGAHSGHDKTWKSVVLSGARVQEAQCKRAQGSCALLASP